MRVILGIALIYGFVHNFIPVGIMLVYPILGNDNFHRQSVATMHFYGIITGLLCKGYLNYKIIFSLIETNIRAFTVTTTVL